MSPTSPLDAVEELLRREVDELGSHAVVDAADLAEARAALDRRIHVDHGRRRRRVLAGVAIAAVAVPLLAVGGVLTAERADGPDPAGTDEDRPERSAFLVGEPVTAESVVGMWRVDNGITLIALGADGSYRADEDGELWTDPAVSGTYEVVDGEVFVRTDPGSARCLGEDHAFQASLPETDIMRVVNTETTDGCPGAMNWSSVLERVLPTGPTYADFGVPKNGRWAPPEWRQSYLGDWMAERGDYVLELARSGRYVVAAGSGEVVDQGTWQPEEDLQRLRLVSDTGSPSCNAGDTLLIGAVEQWNMGTWAMRGSVERDDCGGGWATKEWAHLPDAARH